MTLQRVPIRLQLFAVIGCFAVPILLLFGLFLNQSNKDIQFTAAEQAGVSYLDAVWPVHRALVDAALAGRAATVAPSQLAALDGAAAAFAPTGDASAAAEGLRGALRPQGRTRSRRRPRSSPRSATPPT